ncbi:hypothetical protein [Shewanella aestuarii]|uniref:Uncharacterized protein n=1 Tax=Shewanella aestuarii TaxID=1028752 RepID=A0A6G9QMR4_9GAMM|nr:hypothetical protein [Shewanella aestuarii]QIR15874.1 hypothetical protein HBH39_16450 [Shewanella aestuarii]
MRFNPSFSTANLKNRLITINPIVAFASLVIIMFLSIFLLPFILLFAVLSFITMQILGRRFTARMQPFAARAQQQYQDIYQGRSDIQREQRAPFTDMFSSQANKPSHHSGRTFEHQAD